ncbi:hypothetical protein [Klebsiella pneumoniae]|uniref:gp53-like domain-containing protein n=1 Tax=Klebsiella pneumoniae TaxID=573 RepID=UPI0039C3472D
MYFVDNDTGVDAMPEVAPKQSDTVKWFTKGGGGTSPTVPGQDTWNIWQAELLNILNAAGISPDKTKLDQLATAIKSLAVSEVGIDGDVAYRDKDNAFTEENVFATLLVSYKGGSYPVWHTGNLPNPVRTVNAVKPDNSGNVQLVLTDITSKKFAVLDEKNTFTKINSFPNIVIDRLSWNNGSGSLALEGKNTILDVTGARFIVRATSYDDFYITANQNSYKIWNAGNLNPVRTVNGLSPDANGDVAATGATLVENGYFQDNSSGRIEQWGKTAVLSEKGNPITVSFNTPFSRQCFNVQLTVIHDKSEKGNVAVYLVDAGTTSFRINLDNADEGADVAISWFAVGV